eukprot:2304966-Amphidinium_carterae.1
MANKLVELMEVQENGSPRALDSLHILQASCIAQGRTIYPFVPVTPSAGSTVLRDHAANKLSLCPPILRGEHSLQWAVSAHHLLE